MNYYITLNYSGENHYFTIKASSEKSAKIIAIKMLEKKLGKRPGILNKNFTGSKANFEIEPIKENKMNTKLEKYLLNESKNLRRIKDDLDNKLEYLFNVLENREDYDELVVDSYINTIKNKVDEIKKLIIKNN